jgi:hypothetical protein
MSKVILALCLLLAAVILVASIDTEEFDSDNNNMMVSSYDKCTRLPLFLKCPKLTIWAISICNVS